MEHHTTRFTTPIGRRCGEKTRERTYCDQPNSRRRRQSSQGRKIPAGVIMPVMRSAGVTSKPGFNARLEGLATIMKEFLVLSFEFLVERTPRAPSTSLSLRSSIGMSMPDFKFQSMVDKGIAT